MRVATLTFHRALNYGSAMQAFALWKAIADLGHDVEVIDFAPEGQDDLYKAFSKPNSARALLKNVRALPFAGRLAVRRESFSAFLTDNARLSAKACRGAVGEEILNSYDAVVVGSDQIWNPNAKDFTTEYMLPRGDSFRRVAYAPSLNGASLDAVPDAPALLSRFDALSAREASGAREIERVLGGSRRIETVLDPTLLLSADDFREAESDTVVPEKYIFLYSVTFRKAAVDYAMELAARTGYPVISMFTTDRTYRAMWDTKGRVRFLDYVSPGDFIRLVDRASYVVTNSFHGTAFSVLFGKPFVAVRSVVNGAILHDHRVDNLLGQAGLMCNVAEEGAFPDGLPLEYDIEGAHERLTGAREASLAYLRSALA